MDKRKLLKLRTLIHLRRLTLTGTPLDSMGLGVFSHRHSKIAFDRASRLPYTLLFVRDVTNLSGVVPVVLEPFSWKDYLRSRNM